MLSSGSRFTAPLGRWAAQNPSSILSNVLKSSARKPNTCIATSSRYFSTVNSSPLDQFRDSTLREKRFTESVGRSWSAKELRRKSFDDLHKLWFVLYKEKNMLLSESHICRQNGVYFPQKERQRKTKKSMAAIKTVLGERKRDKIAQHALKLLEQEDIENGKEMLED